MIEAVMRAICYVRSLLATGLLILSTIFFGSLVIFFGLVTGNTKQVDWIAPLWGKLMLWSFNMHLHFEGLENIPKGGCLFIFNHVSLLDIPIVCATLPRSAKFGAKIELFSIPMFGQIMRSAGVLAIVRHDREGVLKLYQEQIAKLEAGEWYILAAEGTRQVVEGVGSKFKAGPFIFAISAKTDLVPIVIRGAGKCLPKGKLIACRDQWRHDLTVKILPAISAKGYTIDERGVLQDQAQAVMTNAYNQV